LDLALDFGLEQPPRTSYAHLTSYIPYMPHLSTGLVDVVGDN
jgi:hypothetical protein